MSALDAFHTVWTNARHTFGNGAPHSGSTFDASAKLRSLGHELAGATTEPVWSGRAATAYTARIAGYRTAVDGVADLDLRLGGLINRSARIVGAGHQDLESLHNWISVAAEGVLPGLQRETVLSQIASTGLARIAAIVRAAQDDLDAIAQEINAVQNLYQVYASRIFGEAPAPAAGNVSGDAGERRATDMSSGDVDLIDRANREMLQDMFEEYEQLPAGRATADRLADIHAISEALTVPGSRLVYLEKPDHPSQMIPAAIAVGDPFTADHVSVTAPGVSGSTRETIRGMTAEAAELRDEATNIAILMGASRDIATIAWVGYQPPPNLGDPSVLSDDLAQVGAAGLTAFLRDLDAATTNSGQSTALFGYSYGSLMSGIALQDGASQHVDNAVLYGSPGFQADTPAQLGMTDDNFFVMSARDDPINTIGALAPYHGWGSDPNDIINEDGRLRFRFQHLETDAGATPIFGYESKTGASGHSDYERAAGESMTGYNLAAILLNRPDLAVRETPLSW